MTHRQTSRAMWWGGAMTAVIASTFIGMAAWFLVLGLLVAIGGAIGLGQR